MSHATVLSIRNTQPVETWWHSTYSILPSTNGRFLLQPFTSGCWDGGPAIFQTPKSKAVRQSVAEAKQFVASPVLRGPRGVSLAKGRVRLNQLCRSAFDVLSLKSAKALMFSSSQRFQLVTPAKGWTRQSFSWFQMTLEIVWWNVWGLWSTWESG